MPTCTEVPRAISADIFRPRRIYMANRFHNRRSCEDYIVRLRLLSCPLSLILALRCCTFQQFIHDTTRKRDSADSWRCLLGSSGTIGDFHFLLWCVLLEARGIRPIHKFYTRSVRCTPLGVGRHLCVCFLLPQTNKT